MKRGGADIAIGPGAGLVERRADVLAITKALWPVLLICFLALLQQALGSLAADISWLITASEEVLDGKTAYIDILESNPPASILLYIPATVAARLFSGPPEFMVALFCFAGMTASLTLSTIILLRVRLAEKIDLLALGGAAAVLALLPAHVFAQREHIAVIVGLPFFSMVAARVSGAQFSATLRLLAGLGAGVMASIKPHFALMILAVLPYFIWRLGWRAAIASMEFYVAAVVCALYAAAVAAFFPAYVNNVVPLVFAIYLPVRFSWFDMASGFAFASWLTLGVYLIATARGAIGHPLVATPALASCGGMLAYFVQGKGWPYQSYPAIALMAMALVFAMPRGEGALRRFAPGAICLALVLAISLVAPEARLRFGLMVVPTGAVMIIYGVIADCVARRRGEKAEVSTLTLGFLAAVTWSWFDHQASPFDFEAKAATLTPHPKVLVVSENLSDGFPFLRRIGGVWAQRTNTLWIASGARWLIAQSRDDPTVIAKMQPYLQLERDMLVEDIRHNRPDIILINNGFEKIRDWTLTDPLVDAALANYRLYARDNSSRDVLLYARNDLIPQPDALDDASPVGPPIGEVTVDGRNLGLRPSQ
jgi:hypothetical protein